MRTVAARALQYMYCSFIELQQHCVRDGPTGHKLNWCTQKVTANWTLELEGIETLVIGGVTYGESWIVRWFWGNFIHTLETVPCTVCWRMSSAYPFVRSTTALELLVMVTNTAAVINMLAPFTKQNSLVSVLFTSTEGFVSNHAAGMDDKSA